MNTPEQLTEEEREFLKPNVRRYRLTGDITAKALRIIDAHAADRAALVTRVAELEQKLECTREDARDE